MKIIKTFDKCLYYIVRVLEILAAFLLLEMTAVCFANVLFRFVIDKPLVWSDEVLRYSSIWCVFLLCPVLVIQKGHLMVDMTSMLFPRKVQKYAFFLGTFLCMLFVVVLIPASFRLCKLGLSQVSSLIGLNMAFVYSCIPISLILMTVCFLRVGLNDLFPDKAPLPLEKPGGVKLENKEERR